MSNDKKNNFQKLTPVDHVDLKLYSDALDFVFKNQDIRNVAISGAYGAGKSSVLESYKSKNKDKTFLHISLAHFEQPDNELLDGGKQIHDSKVEDGHQNIVIPSHEVKESVLEGKILNQLIHQIPASKIPQTNFRVKKSVSYRDILISVIVTVIFIFSLLHVLLFTNWSAYIETFPDTFFKSFLDITVTPYSRLISGVLCAAAFGLFLWTIFKAQKNKNIFKKISFQGNDIEIFESSEESYFDKYLNEVLYLFENTEADVIVFEDMDRFNANRIFERLREVNTLVNIQLDKDKKRSKPIRFFYLLRDDIFISKERTKFFDFIMPVVPVVDSSNSYDQFISHFKDGGIYELFDENFLQGLSLYVDDMRILKNIYNEFVIYYNRLNTTELDCNKMLALITYKNIFPRDFSDLQLNRGFIYTMFVSKDMFMKIEIENIRAKIADKQDEIDSANNEHLRSLTELKVIYDHYAGVDYWKNPRPLTEEKQQEYDKRKLALENKKDNRIGEIEEEIADLKAKLVMVKNHQLKDLVTRDNIEQVFHITSMNDIGVEETFNDVKGNEYFPLLKYLIRNGYIDETYADYMTYFYEQSLSRIDKTFLRSVSDKNAKEFSYRLKNPMLVTNWLRIVDYDQEETLNFDLLEYLLLTDNKQLELTRFLTQLKDTKNANFVGEFFSTERVRPEFTNALNKVWPAFFSYARSTHALTEKQLREYSICTLYYSEKDTIKEVDGNGVLCNYISASNDFLNIREPDVKRIIDGCLLLDVSFKAINLEVSDLKLFDQIYKHSIYELNAENINLMLAKFYNVSDKALMRHSNYTLVSASPKEPLSEYVELNINDYIQLVIESSDGIISDSEDTVLKLLNNENVNMDLKVAYIDLLKTVLPSIKDISDTPLWAQMIKQHLVLYTPKNILDYYVYKQELDSILVNLINDTASDLDFSDISTTYDKDVLSKFFSAVITSNKIENSKYREILVSIGYHYKNFGLTNIQDSKITILIDENIIKMNEDTLVFMRESYPQNISHFIEHNINEYAELINDDLFEISELLEILKWNVSIDIKYKMLAWTDAAFSVLNKGYTADLVVFLLRNHLEEEDIDELLRTYDDWDVAIRDEIQKIAVQNVEVIVENSIKIPDSLFNILIAENTNIPRSKKIDLFISILPKQSRGRTIEILDALNLPEYKKVFETKTRPKYPVSTESTILLSAFKENHIIGDFAESDDKPEYYKIIRNIPKSSSVSTELL